MMRGIYLRCIAEAISIAGIPEFHPAGSSMIVHGIFLITTPKFNILIPLVFPKRTDLLHECVIY
jgi:hypothetical protein